MLRYLHSIVTLCCFCFISASLRAEVRYSIVDLGIMPGTSFSQAVAINNNNQITGFCDAWDIAFFWENGVFTDIGGFGGNYEQPKAINDHGQITGVSSSYAFLWESGNMLDIGSLFDRGSYGYDINNNCQIVGSCYQPVPGECAFLWQNNVMINLGIGRALAINNNGLIAGSSGEEAYDRHAVIWDNGSMIDLGLFAGSYAEPHGINDNEQVIVFSHGFNDGNSIYNAAFLWDDGIEINLGVLEGYRNSQPYGLNNACQIVGESYDLIGQEGINESAFLWENGYLFDLNDLIPKASGWSLEVAYDINDNGYIVGYGYNPAGQMRGYLLEPVPEPCTLALLVLGGLAVARRRR